MGIIKALFLQSLPRRYGISIYIGVSLIYPRWYFAYIQNNAFFFSGFAHNLCISLYRRNNAFSSYIQEIDTFSFQVLPQNLYVFLIYSKNTILPRLYFSIQGKTILFLYRCLFFSLFCPRIQGCLYIQEPLSFLYIAQ